ncbi:MAG: VanZ family protein [Gallionella sp.]|jgi:VanZ family protein
MLKYHRFWLAVGWLLVGLVIYLSLAQVPPAPFTFEHADKLSHVLAYATLSFWFCHLYVAAWSRAAVIVALVGLEIGLEYVQGWTGYRSFDVLDMLAGSVGVLLGWLLVLTPLGRLLVHIERRLAR